MCSSDLRLMWPIVYALYFACRVLIKALNFVAFDNNAYLCVIFEADPEAGEDDAPYFSVPC